MRLKRESTTGGREQLSNARLRIHLSLKPNETIEENTYTASEESERILAPLSARTTAEHSDPSSLVALSLVRFLHSPTRTPMPSNKWKSQLHDQHTQSSPREIRSICSRVPIAEKGSSEASNSELGSGMDFNFDKQIRENIRQVNQVLKGKRSRERPSTFRSVFLKSVQGQGNGIIGEKYRQHAGAICLGTDRRPLKPRIKVRAQTRSELHTRCAPVSDVLGSSSTLVVQPSQEANLASNRCEDPPGSSEDRYGLHDKVSTGTQPPYKERMAAKTAPSPLRTERSQRSQHQPTNMRIKGLMKTKARHSVIRARRVKTAMFYNANGYYAHNYSLAARQMANPRRNALPNHKPFVLSDISPYLLARKPRNKEVVLWIQDPTSGMDEAALSEARLVVGSPQSTSIIGQKSMMKQGRVARGLGRLQNRGEKILMSPRTHSVLF